MKLRHWILPAAVALLTACNTIPVSTEDGEPGPESAPGDTAENGDTAETPSAEDSDAAPPAEEQSPQEYAQFTREQLTSAIAGELAAMRGHMDQATRMYYMLAMETGDTAIISRASEFATAAGQYEAARALARRWIQREPDASTPHQLLAYQSLEQGNLLQAIEHMGDTLERGGQGDFTALSTRSSGLDQSQHRELLQRLQRLHERYPDEASLAQALIQVLDQAGQSEQAREMLGQTRERFGDSPRLRLLDAQLLQNEGLADEALQALNEAVDRYPRHRLLRYNYGQLLVRDEELEAAREQFAELVDQRPDDLQSLYSLSLLNLELEAPQQARRQLQRLVNAGYRINTTRYYLGSVEERLGNPDAALTQYRRVDPQSGAFMIAQQRAMQLLINEGRLEEAAEWREEQASPDSELGAELANMEAEALLNRSHLDRAAVVLNETLEHHPRNVRLLFTRTLLHDRRNDLENMESDLRRILAINPDHAQALNHLGYALLERTDRHDEALELIRRAIEVAPEDPAIRDSLGWAQYKTGEHEAALRNLRQAYESFPNHEVAAHLGEVLWVLGEEEQAREIWNEGLERRPNSGYIRDTMERLLP